MELEEETEYERDKHPLKHLKEFILTLKKIPELWDMKHPAYSDKYIRTQKYAILLPILQKVKPNAELGDVGKKIRALQSCYRREKRKVAKNPKYVPKLWYYPLLQFLEKKKTDQTKALLTENDSSSESAKETMEHEEETDCERDQHPLEYLKEFIEALENMPELWDTKHPSNSNKYIRGKKHAILLPILKKINPDSKLNDVQRKIRMMKACYRREGRKIAADDKYVSKLWYYPLLHFLGKEKTGQPTDLEIEYDLSSEASSTKTQTKIRSTRKKKLELANDDSKYFNKYDSQFSHTPETITHQSVKSKPYTLSVEFPTSPNQSPKTINQPFTSNTNNQYFANPLAIEWANTLERLDPIQRLFAKKAINDVLFEAELGNLSRDSISINMNSSNEAGIVFTEPHYNHAADNERNHLENDSSDDSTSPS